MAGLTKVAPAIRVSGRLAIHVSIGPQPEYFTEIVLANLGRLNSETRPFSGT